MRLQEAQVGFRKGGHMFSRVNRRGGFVLGVVLLGVIGWQISASAEMKHVQVYQMNQPAGPNIKVHRISDPAGPNINVQRIDEPAGPNINVQRIGEPAGRNINVQRLGEPGPNSKVHHMGEPAGPDIYVQRISWGTSKAKQRASEPTASNAHPRGEHASASLKRLH